MLMSNGGATVHHGSAYGASCQTFETGLEVTLHDDSEDERFSESTVSFSEDAASEISAESTSLDLASLRPLGVLSRCSADKDWALIAIARYGNAKLAAFLASDQEDLSTVPLAQTHTGGGLVHTHTAWGGKTTGTILSTVSDYRPPYGT
ncbi:hypothetical protein ST47_g7615 [Ascochyta rabiei]|uniref:Uncharacterized protein n=1 Tax=Didymella rabiei TaxID=5454 RepID=A0A163AKN3_DIDRA|nr:hypothetical protein ST47_g7615 [Ascochyta rabiei]